GRPSRTAVDWRPGLPGGVEVVVGVQLARGQRLRELLKQSQSAPLTVEEQIVTIYTGKDVGVINGECGCTYVTMVVG
ncbi:hypothetical protein KC217_24635, partial [Mycobacterium tuberculosis]|nr:hypothetical protein [Mycobacterium tuberculosis]